MPAASILSSLSFLQDKVSRLSTWAGVLEALVKSIRETGGAPSYQPRGWLKECTGLRAIRAAFLEEEDCEPGLEDRLHD